MVAQHYRWDFVGLSTDVKPTPATSEKVVDGSTFYCSDTSKLYVYCKDNWYERKSLGGGGGGTSYTAGDGIVIAEDTISVDLVQETGASETKVMSQNATTGLVFQDPTNKQRIRIGNNASIDNNSIAIGTTITNVGTGAINIGSSTNTLNGGNAISIGGVSNAKGKSSIAIGYDAKTTDGTWGAIALGSHSRTTSDGEINVGSTRTDEGYKSSNYRLISGVHDGESDHDVVTVGQVNALIDVINSALNVNISHIGS